MMNKIVGRVTEPEKNTILELYEKKTALESLLKVIKPTENAEMYEKLMSDYTKNSALFSSWWSDNADKYNWEGSQNGAWEIDFQNGDIILVEKHT